MKKLIALCLALLLALPVAALADTVKDETVYGLLGADGALREVIVVSHLDTPEDGEYVDYGEYTEISALSADVTPTVDGDAITWNLTADTGGFYAAGVLEAAQLPFALAIGYTLDGEPVAPNALAGQSGRVAMTISFTTNPDAAEAFRTGYAAQAQVPLSMEKAANVEAPGATASLVGRTLTLAYTVLPGQDASFTLSFDATDFAMDSITVACAPMDIGGMLGLDIGALGEEIGQLTEGAQSLADGGAQLSEGVAALETGVGTLAGGATQVSDGLAALQDSAGQLTGGLGALPEQLTQLTDGSGQLANGVSAYVDGVQQAVDGVQQLTGALDTVAAGGQALEASFTQVRQALGAVIAQMPEQQQAMLTGALDQFEQGLGQYAAGVSAIGEQAGGLTGGAEALAESGAALKTGVSAQDAGIAQLAEGLTGMAQQAQALPEGIAQLAGGAAQVSGGLDTLKGQMTPLAEAAGQLSQGQQTLADGIAEAVGALDGMPLMQQTQDGPQSFVSEGHAVRSVQFVYRTDAIAVEAEAAPMAAEDAPKTFWDRLTALF